MKISDLTRDWDAFGRNDPFWAILTAPEKRHNKWLPAEFFETGAREIAELMSYIGELGVELKRRKALDFGCRAGRLSQALGSYFEEVHGVDVAPSMISLANSLNQRKCIYHVNPSTRLELFGEDTFDLNYSNITLQHIPPAITKSYLSEFIRVLAPGGLLVFQLPSSPVNPLKQATKRTVAKGVLQLFRTVGYIRRPIMVMHSMERENVVSLLRHARATVIDIRPSESSGKDWFSYRYCVTKR